MGDPHRTFTSLDYLAGAALLSIAAGAIHARVIFDHLGEGALIAEFFAVTAVLQIWWGFRVAHQPNKPLLVFALGLSAIVIVTWAVSRTIGVPVGPLAGERESVGAVDLIATAYEVGIIVAVLRSWRHDLPTSIPRRAVHPSVYFLVAPVAVVTLYAIIMGHHAEAIPR